MHRTSALPPMEVSGQLRISGETRCSLRNWVALYASAAAIQRASRRWTFVFRDGRAPAYQVNVSRMPVILYIKSIHWAPRDHRYHSHLTNGVPRAPNSPLSWAPMPATDGAVTNEKSEPCEGVTVTLIPRAHRSRAFY